jgi:hypothetical protein
MAQLHARLGNEVDEVNLGFDFVDCGHGLAEL